MDLVVETDRGLLHMGDATAPCVIGRSGACEAADKREGDGRTPLGRWAIRAVLLRPEHGFLPPAALPWRWLRPDDGWSDGNDDPAYNRPVCHPHAFSAERLWREDAAYDAIVILGHNDDPPVPDMGSAIFLHLRTAGPTEGCVAVDREAMARLLAELTSRSILHVCRHVGDGHRVG